MRGWDAPAATGGPRTATGARGCGRRAPAGSRSAWHKLAPAPERYSLDEAVPAPGVFACERGARPAEQGWGLGGQRCPVHGVGNPQEQAQAVLIVNAQRVSSGHHRSAAPGPAPRCMWPSAPNEVHMAAQRPFSCVTTIAASQAGRLLFAAALPRLAPQKRPNRGRMDACGLPARPRWRRHTAGAPTGFSACLHSRHLEQASPPLPPGAPPAANRAFFVVRGVAAGGSRGKPGTCGQTSPAGFSANTRGGCASRVARG
jgi:hypothetical protein